MFNFQSLKSITQISSYLCFKLFDMLQFAGFLGGYEVLIIVVVVLLLFGGKKIPELAKGLGRGIKDFKKATEDSEIAKDLKDVASEINDMKDGVKKMNPKNLLKPENPLKPKKKDAN